MSLCCRVILAIALAVALSAPERPTDAQDAVWNLRTPEWRDAFAAMPDGEAARLEFIRVASQVAAYSGFFYPVTPVDIATGLPLGHVPVDLAWFSGEPGLLVFGLARGWAHLVLGHETLAEAGTPQDAALWLAGSRHAPADEAAADAWAARFLADLGYDAQPVIADLCTAPGGTARAAVVVDAHESVLGWAPQASCATPIAPQPVLALESCSDRFDACRATIEHDASACHRACYAVDCAIACSGGGYDQCSDCTTSCGRGCNALGAQAHDACLADNTLCEADDG